MESKALLEKIFINSKQGSKKKSLFFWKLYLKKSWFLYTILLVFTSIFIALYLISGIKFQLYAAIFYPIILLLVLICEGIIRNILFLKRLDYNDAEIEIYSECLRVTNIVAGYTFISEFPYKNMINIFNSNSNDEIVFELRKNSYLAIPKNKLLNSTIEFLVALGEEMEEA